MTNEKEINYDLPSHFKERLVEILKYTGRDDLGEKLLVLLQSVAEQAYLDGWDSSP